MSRIVQDLLFRRRDFSQSQLEAQLELDPLLPELEDELDDELDEEELELPDFERDRDRDFLRKTWSRRARIFAMISLLASELLVAKAGGRIAPAAASGLFLLSAALT